jgi:inorganic triphosphatase YgiF
MSTETELKLHIAPEDTDQFRQHPLLQSASDSQQHQHLYSVYFDTPECKLLEQGIGLRVRHLGDKRVQTIKTAGSGLSGLHQRQEWENEIIRDTPDYAQFPVEALPEWCTQKQNQQQIEALFITDFWRTTWRLILDDGSEIEVALDQGEVKTKTKSFPLSEVELELKAGTPDKLYKIALAFQTDLPLRLENKSKAAKGYALHKPKPPQFHKASAVKLQADMNVEQAFEQIMWHCLGHLQANEDMVLYGDNIEGVHQMRVALRRLRSCLTLYKPVISKKNYAKFYPEVKWITGVLGVARDWDVFAFNLHTIQSQTNHLGLFDLQKQVTKFQTSAYAEVREALHSPRYSRLLLFLGKWLTQRRWRRKRDATALKALETPLPNFASQMLETYFQHIQKKGENFATLDPDELHKLRISIKKLTYGTRFFMALYPHDVIRPYAKKLARLQDELGILNDGNVATQLLNQAELEQNAPARHFLNGWYAHQHKTHFTQLESAWQAFLAQKMFW